MTIDDFEQQVMAERDAEIEKKLQDEENQRVHFTMQEISNLEKDLAQFQAGLTGKEGGPTKLQITAKQRRIQEARKNLSILVAITQKHREERAQAAKGVRCGPSMFKSETSTSDGITRRHIPPHPSPAGPPPLRPPPGPPAPTPRPSAAPAGDAGGVTPARTPSLPRCPSVTSTDTGSHRKALRGGEGDALLPREQRFAQAAMTSISKVHLPHGRTQPREISAEGRPITHATTLDRKRKRTLIDDGNDEAFEKRKARCKAGMDNGEAEIEEVEFDGGLRLPGELFDRMFDYQQVCLKWLWELHTQKVGGIIGDEMGLGKTIQLIVYLEALRYSGLVTGPILIVCPATILSQWVREFQAWAPEFRVSVYHSTGSGARDKKAVLGRAQRDAGSVVITTYSAVRIEHEDLVGLDWYYVVLDEGHLIKNPDSDVTLACKSLLTPHRIILSGSPIQNNLTELWSLFDFVFPGRLGTLPIFQAQFALPIDAGGYTNATPLQVKTAYKCAVTLCSLIQPYLLRRLKKDVNAWLPAKTEQVLFCRLSDDQLIDYANFLKSEEVQKVLCPQRTPFDDPKTSNINIAFRSIMILRKICNHPNLIQYTVDDDATNTAELVDNIERRGRLTSSGKMKVLEKLLQQWKEQERKVLVFSQTRVMLDIIERFVALQGYTYLRMDGNTPISSRIHLVDQFNSDPSIFVALLTAKVGGVGINLIGASRVVIYDPDWNPTTDLQARERAWRIGQKQDVAVYRLMCSGTIEEKIYHRQIFKQFLTEKVLNNPDQKRFFKQKDLRELFTLGDQYNESLKRLYREENRGKLPLAVKLEMRRRKRSGEVLQETASLFREAELKDVSLGDIPRRKRGHEDRSAASPLSAEVSNIEACDRVEDYDSEEDREAAQKQDGHLLQRLFDQGEVDVVMDHDRILTKHQSIDDELAERVAKEAKETLSRHARLLQRGQKIGTPTWTGNSGTAGAPSGRPRGGIWATAARLPASPCSPATQGSAALRRSPTSPKAVAAAPSPPPNEGGRPALVRSSTAPVPRPSAPGAIAPEGPPKSPSQASGRALPRHRDGAAAAAPATPGRAVSSRGSNPAKGGSGSSGAAVAARRAQRATAVSVSSDDTSSDSESTLTSEVESLTTEVSGGEEETRGDQNGPDLSSADVYLVDASPLPPTPSVGAAATHPAPPSPPATPAAPPPAPAVMRSCPLPAVPARPSRPRFGRVVNCRLGATTRPAALHNYTPATSTPLPVGLLPATLAPPSATPAATLPAAGMTETELPPSAVLLAHIRTMVRATA
eukprot:EG_transcript_588